MAITVKSSNGIRFSWLPTIRVNGQRRHIYRRSADKGGALWTTRYIGHHGWGPAEDCYHAVNPDLYFRLRVAMQPRLAGRAA